MGIYVGLKEKVKAEIIKSETAPPKESHPQYDFTYGLFKTVQDAQKYIKAMGELTCDEG